MSQTPSSLGELINRLRQERDELKLQIHLGGMEAKDEYERISGKVDELSKQYEPVKDAAGETTDNLLAALSLVADELKAGYQRVRHSIAEKR